MALARERLQDELKVNGVENVDDAAARARNAILEIVRKESSFAWNVFNALPWHDALTEYQKVAAEVAAFSGERIEEPDLRLGRCQRVIGGLLRSASADGVTREYLEKRLELQGISTSSDVMTRFLVSELNAELELPRVIGIISQLPEHKPFYVALPDMAGLPSEFLTVCRIFDH
ncbi:MAG: hypothetical protein WC813_00125 [Patescibacteria group bacterium]